jgi:hypothetical protein
MIANPFLVTVNPSGLPHFIPTQPATGDELLSGMSPQEIATVFWMLQSLSISYSYSISDLGNYANSFEITCTTPPVERLISFPAFTCEFINENTHMGTSFQLNPAQVYETTTNSYAFNLSFQEGSYPNGEILLSVSLPIGHTVLASSSFSIFSRTVPVHLSTVYGELSGAIDSFVVTENYWHI